MKFIRVFDNDSDYLSYRNGTEYTRPNVSLSRDPKKVHYNYPIWETNGHDYIDLGLPSGTLWATMNVGASDPSDKGLYFQWGDTQGYTVKQIGNGNGKKKFASDWSDYKFGKPNFSKYKTTGAILDLEDDAAHVHMGGDWHMPTPTQIQELIDNTTSSWALYGDTIAINGIKFTSKKDKSKSIFIPAAGVAWDGSVHGSGTGADVWSSMLDAGNVNNGRYLVFDSGSAGLGNGYRSCGFSVRGVLG